MKICFVEEKSIINHDQYLPLGKLTCEQLNGTDWNEHGLPGAQLFFFDPDGETTVIQFLAGIKNAQKAADRMKAFLNGNRYYQMNDKAANAFAAVEELLSKTCRQLENKMCSGDECVPDLGIEIDVEALQKASAYFDALYRTHTEAVRVFTRLADAVMIRNEEYPQRRTVERMQAFGFDRFQKAVKELVQETETAAFSVYAPDFDMLTLPDGSIKIAPVVNINNIAQLMYHEFMNMTMQGHSLRRCKNCGKYFVQYGDRIVDYCEEISEGETKPCSAIGSSRQFTASLKNDLIKQTYTRVYKKYVARRRAQAITDAQFVAWSSEAKKLRAQAYESGMHEEAFRLQLDELMENIKGGLR